MASESSTALLTTTTTSTSSAESLALTNVAAVAPKVSASLTAAAITNQNELMSGWSCIVHQPSEDPEPSSLPSTVDIAAFSDVTAALEVVSTTLVPASAATAAASSLTTGSETVTFSVSAAASSTVAATSSARTKREEANNTTESCLPRTARSTVVVLSQSDSGTEAEDNDNDEKNAELPSNRLSTVLCPTVSSASPSSSRSSTSSSSSSSSDIVDNENDGDRNNCSSPVSSTASSTNSSVRSQNATTSATIIKKNSQKKKPISLLRSEASSRPQPLKSHAHCLSPSLSSASSTTLSDDINNNTNNFDSDSSSTSSFSKSSLSSSTFDNNNKRSARETKQSQTPPLSRPRRVTIAPAASAIYAPSGDSAKNQQSQKSCIKTRDRHAVSAKKSQNVLPETSNADSRRSSLAKLSKREISKSGVSLTQTTGRSARGAGCEHQPKKNTRDDRRQRLRCSRSRSCRDISDNGGVAAASATCKDGRNKKLLDAATAAISTVKRNRKMKMLRTVLTEAAKKENVGKNQLNAPETKMRQSNAQKQLAKQPMRSFSKNNSRQDVDLSYRSQRGRLKSKNSPNSPIPKKSLSILPASTASVSLAVNRKEHNQTRSRLQTSPRNSSRSSSSSSSSSISSSSSSSSSTSSSSSSSATSSSSSNSSASSSGSSSSSSSSSSGSSSGSTTTCTSSRSRSNSIQSGNSDSESRSRATDKEKTVQNQSASAQQLTSLSIADNCDEQDDDEDEVDEFECQLINKAIERVESSPDSSDLNDEKVKMASASLISKAVELSTSSGAATTSDSYRPSTYSNSLLQQFAKQTQLLNEGGCAHPITVASLATSSLSSPLPSGLAAKSEIAHGSHNDMPNEINSFDGQSKQRCHGSDRSCSEEVGVEREERVPRQSRALSTRRQPSHLQQPPLSQPPLPNIVVEPDEYFGGISSNVSPDSGIQDSPEHLFSPNSSPRPTVDRYASTATTAAMTTHPAISTSCITATTTSTSTLANTMTAAASAKPRPTSKIDQLDGEQKRRRRQRRERLRETSMESLQTIVPASEHHRSRGRGRGRSRRHRCHASNSRSNRSSSSADIVQCRRKRSRKTVCSDNIASVIPKTISDTRKSNRSYGLTPSILLSPAETKRVKSCKKKEIAASSGTGTVLVATAAKRSKQVFLESVKKVVHCRKQDTHLVRIVNEVRRKSGAFLSTTRTHKTPVTTDEYERLTKEFLKKCNIMATSATSTCIATGSRAKQTSKVNGCGSGEGVGKGRVVTRRTPGRRKSNDNGIGIGIGIGTNASTVPNVCNEFEHQKRNELSKSKGPDASEIATGTNGGTPSDLNVSSSSNSNEEQRLPLKKRQHYHRPPTLASSSASAVPEVDAAVSSATTNYCTALITTENGRRESVIRAATKNQCAAESNCLDIVSLGAHEELTRKCGLRKKRKDVNGETDIIDKCKKGAKCVTSTRTVATPGRSATTITKTVTFKDCLGDESGNSRTKDDALQLENNNCAVDDAAKGVSVEDNVVANEANVANAPLLPCPSSNHSRSSTVDRATNVKRRKRRTINRTGFPSIRKKKKKPVASRIENIGETRLFECGEIAAASVPVLEHRKQNVQNGVDVLPSSLVQNSAAEENKERGCIDAGNAVSDEEIGQRRERVESESDSDYEELPVEEHDVAGASLAWAADSESVEHRSGPSEGNPNDKSRQCLKAEKKRSSDRVQKKIREKMLEIRRKESEVVENKGNATKVVANSTAGSGTSPHKKRKKYLLAGLYSSFFKDDWPRMRRRKKALKTEPCLQTYPQPLRELMQPLHYGKHLLRQQCDFRLPCVLVNSLSAAAVAASSTLRTFVAAVADMDGTTSPLLTTPVAALPSTADSVIDSWKYRKIRSNVYSCRVLPSNLCDPQPCNCRSTTDTSAQDLCNDEQCINRAIFAECPTRGGSHRCANQRLQQNRTLASALERFMTDSGKGWGVRTKTAIKASELIVEYAGEVVSEPEFKERMTSVYARDCHHYCLHLDGGHVIDAHRMGSVARFVNHSCEPNCEMQKWSVNGNFRMVLFALRDIEPLEELTYDYNFSLFNISEGQVCKCGSKNCRGVICGKSQRLRQQQNNSTANVNGNSLGNGACVRTTRVSSQQQKRARPRKNKAEKRSSKYANAMTTLTLTATPTSALGAEQGSRCFLRRNLRKSRFCNVAAASGRTLCENSDTATRPLSAMAAEATAGTVDAETMASNGALTSIRATKMAVTVAPSASASQCDSNEEQISALTAIFRDMYTGLITAKDENGAFLCEQYRKLPDKSENGNYYEKVADPIDFETIGRYVEARIYRRPEQFNEDVLRLVQNAIGFYGRISESGINAVRLLKIFTSAKRANLARFELILGSKLAKSFAGNEKSTSGEDEDVIRCVCGLYRDEGVMVQCERCLVWQHCECVAMSGMNSADVDDADRAPDPRNDSCYLCERCSPRAFNREIAIAGEYTDDGHPCYVTLMRGCDLQLRQGDAVYVLRDISIPGTDRKHTYETIGNVGLDDFDIFRIERLWRNKDTGQRFAYGHHFLRPHETYHEPTRKFYENEVLRVPLYEVVPIELIVRRCWVLDVTTYCRGRPIDSEPEHIYICEYRVDKRAHLFNKIGKSKSWTVCTKSYAFEKYAERLKITRTFSPYAVGSEQPARRRSKKRKLDDRQELLPRTTDTFESPSLTASNGRRRRLLNPTTDDSITQSKRAKLDEILQKLMNKLPQKNQQSAESASLLGKSCRKKRKTQYEKCK